MNKFDGFPNGDNSEKSPTPRKTAEFKILEEDVETFSGLLEKAVTHQEKAKIIRAVMNISSAEAILAANDVMAANMKESAALLLQDNPSNIAELAIRDSYFLTLNRSIQDKINALRLELGLPPKF